MGSAPSPARCAALLSFALLACGSAASAPTSPTPPAAPPASAAPPANATASPAAPVTAAQCLATAGAARAKRPDEPAKISVRHVLVKYAGSKRAPESVTRTREEACLRAMEARTKLEAGTSFAEVVKAYSEEPGAVSREGAIGFFTRNDVVEPFADAAFELAPGQTSHVVETAFGFHVIQRTE